MFSAQHTTYEIFLLRKSCSGCIANLVASIELIYYTLTGVRQEGRSNAKTGDKALHMQLADCFDPQSSVSFGGNCLAMQALTNLQNHSEYGWVNIGREDAFLPGL